MTRRSDHAAEAAGAVTVPERTRTLALALMAYALAMTMGRGHFGTLNVVLLTVGLFAMGLFVLAETKVASPLIRLTMLRDPVLSTGLAMSALVTTVVMATLVVGPFYLSGALKLDAAHMGLVMSTGPVVAALAGAPAGHFVDRFGAHTITILGLVAMTLGSLALVWIPTRLGIPGYIAPLVLLTAGYAGFQAANNTAVMRGAPPDQRGVVSGMLNVSRNLGLISGASVMGALFAAGSATTDVAAASPVAIAAGMQVTFAVGAALVGLALAVALASRAFSPRTRLETASAAVANGSASRQ